MNRNACLKFAVSSFMVVLLTSFGTALANPSQTAEESAKEKKACVPLKLKVTIRARSELVWLSIHEARTEYPGLESGRVISQDVHGSTLEQKFVVPFLGEATCTFHCVDFPQTRMDYTLINSNLFTAMDGSWTLAPGLDGHSTIVQLSCYVAGKRLLPRFLLKLTLGPKLAKQLDFVKSTAEKKEIEKEASEKPPSPEKQ